MQTAPGEAREAADVLGATLSPSSWGTRQAAVTPIAPPLESGAVVGYFEVRRLLGQGGMGRIYLARDTRLGRLVALKLLRPDLFGPERVRRFLDEARLTARFSHPHIVVIHELGQHEGQPFLALEYLDGESLRDRTRGQRVAASEAARWMLAVARALEAAHAHSIIHCDLKPDNVVLPSDGRVRVVDFGLARAASLASDGARAGTPAYMSPEQWDGDFVDARTDIWSFGVVLAELLTGRNPFRDGAGYETIAAVIEAPPHEDPLGLDEVPPPLAAIVRDCLRLEPSERLSASDLAERLARFVEQRVGPDERVECPFPGLVPFEEQHAGLFFGREEEIDTFLERLRVQPVLPVIGPSGAGKSSFVRAGVIPRLRAMDRWRVVSMRPGSAPIRTLAARLIALDEGQTQESGFQPNESRLEALTRDLTENPRGLVIALLAAARRLRSNILLFVDQLEEVFTHLEDWQDQRAFLQALVTAADDPADPIRVIFTARDDFLGRLAEVPEIQRALERVTVLRRLRPLELRTVLTRPLEAVRFEWDDPTVIDDVLRELADEAAGLPLLQFACRSLWERRDPQRRLLLRSEYDAMGGAGGALAEHAERVLASLTPSQLRAARTLLLRLVGPDGTRRVVPSGQALEGLGHEGDVVLDRLTTARLVAARRATVAHGEPVLELAHESLIRAWSALSRWVADSREERGLLEELGQAAALWEARGLRGDEVWTGDAVRDARHRLERLNVTAPPRVDAFLQAGEERHRRAARTRGTAIVGTFVLLAAIAIGSALAAAAFAEKERHARAQSEQIDLATADIGVFEVELRPFDWDPKTLTFTSVPAEQLPDLRLTIFKPDIDDPSVHGERLQHRGFSQARLDGPGWRERIEARSGAAWLRFDGRGTRGQSCGPSWLFVRRLPGYAERGAPTKLALSVPTCAATRADVIIVPGGPFLRGGLGEPPLTHPEFTDPETVATLDDYGLDRTELPNALFAIWESMAPVTGFAPLELPDEGVLGSAGKPAYPVPAIDAFSAEQICLFLGRRLPSSVEWEKAVRGGLTLPSGPNPAPRRNVPWVGGSSLAANLDGDADGWAATAPVDSMPGSAGPYGHLHLSGNVSEWTSTPFKGGRYGLRIIRGGGFGTDVGSEVHTLSYENTRMPRFAASFDLGVRCAL